MFEKLKMELDGILSEMDENKEHFVTNPEKDFTRKRVLPFEKTMRTIIGMHGNSLRKELIDAFRDIEHRPTKSALVQQRGKIKPEAFRYAFDQFNARTEQYDNARYKGYRLFAVDGTSVNVARNPDTESYFNKQEYNMMHIVALYDICNKTMKDCVIQPRPKMNENSAFVQMVRRNSFPKKSIILGDRGFAGYNLFETVNRAENADYLIRVKNDFSRITRILPDSDIDMMATVELCTTQTKKDLEDIRSGRVVLVSGKSRFGKKKAYITWDYENHFRLTMRVVHFELSTGEYETIITSLSKEEFSLDEIKKLYAMRWGIENAFRELKYGLGLSRFHAVREDFVVQEIYSHLLMYNFTTRIAMHVGLTKSKGKYNYQINFMNAFYICKEFFRGKLLHLIEAELLAQIEPIRPGRKDKRKVLPTCFIPFLYRAA